MASSNEPGDREINQAAKTARTIPASPFEPYVRPVNGVVQPHVKPHPRHAGRQTSMLEKLKLVLKMLLRSDYSAYFRHPVDAIAQNLPDYHSRIFYPMDLSTIEARLNNNYYRVVSEALQDFELIFFNCLLYYPARTPERIARTALRSLLYAKLEAIDVELMDAAQTGGPSSRKRSTELTRQGPPIEVSNCQKQDLIGQQRSLEHIDYLVERYFCQHFIGVMCKKKFEEFNRPFKNAGEWKLCLKDNFENMEKLDWPILEKKLRANQLSGIDDFSKTVRKMFQNVRDHFPNSPTAKECVETMERIFDTLLPKYKFLIGKSRKRSRILYVQTLKNLSKGEELPSELLKQLMTAPEQDVSNAAPVIPSTLDDEININEINKTVDTITIKMVTRLIEATNSRRT
ncbi:SWR1 complex bromodomain subunit bdf1-like [Scaptodrosophila lebanonensis]|uniref:SWR1 complex bromodomain subunit bdf1-like n=1 Tax=Drosophila lebanonensis TaxID=7225 RepID=A0A6J2T1M9_DROLE|nr:SWR1 complex bromodomain subunit bdf1-like [Scaptodrosophila lebanonensis]